MTTFPPFFQFNDRNGRPIDGWTATFLDDDSAEPIIVFKDAGLEAPWGNTITADSLGALPPYFMAARSTAYRIVLTFPDGLRREIRGLTTGAAPVDAGSIGFRMPTVTKSGSTVVLEADDFNKTVEIPTTVGSPAIAVMPSAASVPEGSVIVVRNAGSGQVTFQTLGDDTIDTGSITRQNGSVMLLATPGGYETIGMAAPQTATTPLVMMSLSASYASGITSLAAAGFSSPPAAGVWTFQPLNTVGFNNITDASLLVTGRVQLPAGVYRVTARKRFSGPINAAVEFRSTSTSLFIRSGPRVFATSETGEVVLDDVLDVATPQSFELRWILSGTPDAFVLGDASAIAGVDEVYAQMLIQGGN